MNTITQYFPLLLLPFLFASAGASSSRRGAPLIPPNATVEIEKRATLTVNSFEKGGDGGGASECDERYHKNSEKVVALSTNWFHGMCGKCIKIKGNGKVTRAKVVDECDVPRDHCRKDIVDGSKAVWRALGVREGSDKYGEMGVTWKKC